MEKYPFHHASGSLLYREETYHFRYKGVYAAQIHGCHVPGEQCFFYCYFEEDAFHWGNLPEDVRECNSGRREVFLEFGVNPSGNGFFNTKKAALQTAITMIENILATHDNQQVNANKS